MTTKVVAYDHGINLQGLPLNNAPVQAVSTLPSTTYARVVQLTAADGGFAAGDLVRYNTQTSAWEKVGAGSGTIASVVAGHGVDVDNTDPANPVVAVDETELSVTAAQVSYGGATGISATDVEGALDELAAEKADLASPALTGNPTAPTPSTSDNDTSIATTAFVQAAIVSYVQTFDVSVFKGATDASGNPNYPAAQAGEFYRISVAGKIGGASGKVVEVGDIYMAIADNAGGNEATVGSSWIVLQTNIDGAVVGPVSSVAGDIPTFSNTSGKVLQDSGVLLTDLAPKASPAFTGNPTAPTPAADDNDTSIATTAYVQTELGAERYTALIGDGSTEDINIDHNLNGYVEAQFFTESNGEWRSVAFARSTANRIIAYFPTGAPPANNAVRVVVKKAS